MRYFVVVSVGIQTAWPEGDSRRFGERIVTLYARASREELERQFAQSNRQAEEHGVTAMFKDEIVGDFGCPRLAFACWFSEEETTAEQRAAGVMAIVDPEEIDEAMADYEWECPKGCTHLE
jgi:hypothetical protein